MKETTFSVIKLESSEGMYLTQVELKEGETPMFSKKVFLGINDSPDNWKEVTQEEKDAYELNIKEAELITEPQINILPE